MAGTGGASAAGIARVLELAERGGREIVVLQATGRGEADTARLEGLFSQARQAEWAVFIADCGKFGAEISKGKFTLAELDEEEQSLERLHRWHRERATRDVFGAPHAAEASQQLKALCRAAGRLHRAGLPGRASDVRPDFPRTGDLA